MPAVGCFGARKLQVSVRLRGFVCSMQIEMSEVKKEFYEFKRDVVGGERNFRSGKTASEKVRHSCRALQMICQAGVCCFGP